MNFELEINSVKTQLTQFEKEGKKIFATTSFQTNSVVLLHIISQAAPHIPIYFINTGYLFSETLQFKDRLVDLLELNIVELRPEISKHQQLDGKNRLLYTTDPNRCCEINKVQPLEKIKGEYDVWVNGVRAAQTSVRAGFQKIQPTKSGLLRYHPVLDFNNKMVYQYLSHYDLPTHPLELEGYMSIGCLPCTQKYAFTGSDERGGRWDGMNKTECGLHLEK